MKTKNFVFVIITLLSCTYDNAILPTKEFCVEIIGKVPYCPLTIIEFQLKDIKELEIITGQSGQLRCQTHNVPENLNQTGQKLTVTIRKTRTEEHFACITLGPSFPYPLVTLIDIKSQ